MKSPEELPYFLLEYRNTTIPAIGYSPSQLLLNRLVKSKIPTSVENLLPKIVNRENITSQLEINSKKCKLNFDKTAKDLPALERGDKILFQKENKWNKGQIIDKYNDRSYIITDTLGNKFRRNRKFLNKTNLTVNVCDSELLYEDLYINKVSNNNVINEHVNVLSDSESCTNEASTSTETNFQQNSELDNTDSTSNNVNYNITWSRIRKPPSYLDNYFLY
ncbi:hypothetical protein RN001_001510 [Aquatica leii]|uniref:Uncharacterized protein n=1 Tax=Aquatica leii TaxID=1421715 RepID=A0AAN7SLA1_9COLE|nr:hypothetical protein RN001_001510 [Aquatica leii]